jgi:transcription factor SPN1
MPRRTVNRPQMSQQDRADAARERALALPILSNRARIEGGVGAYTVAPRSNVNALGVQPKQPGQIGEAAFRRRMNRFKKQASKR